MDPHPGGGAARVEVGEHRADIDARFQDLKRLDHAGRLDGHTAGVLNELEQREGNASTKAKA